MNSVRIWKATMKTKLPHITVGATYILKSAGSIWRVESLVRDERHVVLVDVSDRSSRKTLSVTALLDRNRFMPRPSHPAP